MIKLSVNVNKIALIRNSRAGNYPDVLAYARRCIELGADGITVHPRPDRRHIRANDVTALAALMPEYPAIELNIEGNPFASAHSDYPGLMAFVEQVRPAQCTLVPDSDSQLTSDHGFNLQRDGERLRPIIQHLHAQGCRVSLFMDANCAQIDLAKALCADAVEFYTGPYAQASAAHDEKQINSELLALTLAANRANVLGLRVNAGHDLNCLNLPALVRALPMLAEVSIGHALTVDALEWGLATSISAYQNALLPTLDMSTHHANHRTQRCFHSLHFD